jgi:protein phosphatase
VEAGVATDPGCVRAVNEDALRVIRPTTPEGVAQFGVLAVVCDGMGGHEAGEIASHLALETIVKRLESDDRDPPVALMRAVQAANRAIFDAAQANPKLRGMGTTCCALLLRGGAAYSAHVGDSRLYLIRSGEIFLMTEDHSVVMDLVRQGAITREEARSHPDKNVISRALGSHKEVEVSASIQPFSVRPNDAFLICSDGLYDLVSDDELLREVGDLHSQVACDRLISLARQRGGHDNISVAVLRMRDETVRSPSPRETRTIETAP